MTPHHSQQTASSANLPDVLQRPWTPFVCCEPDARGASIQIYRNSRHQVHVRRYVAQDGGADLIHLSIKRLDQRPHVPYRDRMRIKDELVGPEYEAIELLPARSREGDLANQTHLWILDDPTFRFPFGFAEGRLVSDVALDGSTQEPWPENERPADCLSEAEVHALMQRARENAKTEKPENTEEKAETRSSQRKKKDL